MNKRQRQSEWFKSFNAEKRFSRKQELARVIRRMRDGEGLSYEQIAKMKGTTAARIRSYVA